MPHERQSAIAFQTIALSKIKKTRQCLQHK